MPIDHPVIFTPAARLELIDAQDWYEREIAGLGPRFLDAVDAQVQRIGQNPRQFPVVFKTVRRALLRRFPYALFFVIGEDDAIVVIACFHGSRDPQRWQERA